MQQNLSDKVRSTIIPRPQLSSCIFRRQIICRGEFSYFDLSSFSHVTHVFVCKQTVITFGVLFVLKCSFCHSFLFVVDICSLTVYK